MGSSSADRQLKPLADEWTLVFSKSRTRTYAQENRPFWDSPVGLIPATSAEIIKAFLKDFCDDSDPYLYQVIEVEAFCLETDLEILRKADGNDERVTRMVALLDDRNNDGTRSDERGTCRPNKGALSAHQLYHELAKNRFRDSRTLTGVAGPRTALAEADEPDADRRLVYITDLDCWSILAVVATASKNQAAYLRSFIHRHLAFKNFIGVYMPVTGFSTFALEFHIPFYVWRQREGPILDQRRRANGKPLRWSSNLGFLKLDPSDGPASSVEDCIYEAQISCIVTGIDERSWVGYACIDTYYKGDRDDNQESVEYYVEQSINGPRMDPLSGGRFDADKPIWKPREYFLRLLDCRMDQVRQEWHNVVSRALQTTEEYTHDYLLPADDLSPDHTEKYNKRVQRFSRMTIRFLLQIITLLSKTIGSWDTFKEGDLGHFLGLDPLGSTDRSGSSSRLLLTVEKHVSELRVLRNEVEAQKQLLENLEREVTQDLQQDSNKIASLQQQSGEHMKVFSIIALTFLPISTTAAIFSVNSDILPFQPNLRTFAITTICLGAVVLAVLTLILNWSWYRLIPGCLSSFSQRERRWSSPGSSTLGGSSSNGRFRDDLEMNILP